MFVNSAISNLLSNITENNYELVSCDFNKFVIRVETDPTDPTGVYRHEDNTIEVPDNEVTVSLDFVYYILMYPILANWDFFKRIVIS